MVHIATSARGIQLPFTVNNFRQGRPGGGSGIPIYPKKNRQNTPKYPKFLQIYPKIIEALNTLYLKFKESDILNTHI